eukprot:UN22486
MKKIMKWLKILKWLIFVIVEVKFVILTYQQANINPLWIWKILTLKNSLDETTLYYEQQLLEINRKIMELKDIKIPELTQELEQRQRELDKSLEMIIKTKKIGMNGLLDDVETPVIEKNEETPKKLLKKHQKYSIEGQTELEYDNERGYWESKTSNINEKLIFFDKYKPDHSYQLELAMYHELFDTECGINVLF